MPPTSERRAGPDNRVANEAMDRYADGDASAFPILYDAIAPRIEGLVKRRTRDASRIDDIVQQTFERIHRARGTFIRGSDVLSWAFKIARNLCLDLGAEGWRERAAGGGAKAGNDGGGGGGGRGGAHRNGARDARASGAGVPRFARAATARARARARRGFLDGGRGREPRRHASQPEDVRLSRRRGPARRRARRRREAR